MACSATTLNLGNPIPFLSTHHQIAIPNNRLLLHHFSKPRNLSFSPLPIPSKSRICASFSQTLKTPLLKPPKNSNPDQELQSGSTRTITTLFALSIATSKVLAHGPCNLAFQLEEPLLYATGPAFFAAIRGSGTGSLNTPLTVVAAGMAKWLDMYSGVLTVRVMLSWFPNIPWNRQPFSAIRDLCDPYLNLFRNIVPQIGPLDVSSLLAFAFLGTLGSILNSSRIAY